MKESIPYKNAKQMYLVDDIDNKEVIDTKKIELN